MAIFTNRATLSYNGGTINSNTVTGELLEVLSVTKDAVSDVYADGDVVTYVVTIRNTGTSALTGLTATDDLGGYEFEGETVYPLLCAREPAVLSERRGPACAGSCRRPSADHQRHHGPRRRQCHPGLPGGGQ